jgi:5-formyltetrahydrofolate cyclo-ligase
MFVPLLAFDVNGHRVGYGKGFYDQYLAKCSSKIIKIGLSLFDEPSIIDEVESTDIPLDIIITPTRFIQAENY